MNINRIILQSLAEDACLKDVTTNLLISPKSRSQGYIIANEDAIVCGIDIAHRIFIQLDKTIQFKILVKDGKKVRKNFKIAMIKGKTHTLLKGERVALNFLAHLSGIATETSKYINAVRPFKTKILDTRKTTPGLRALEKYAVKCGGGHNHRFNLNEMVLIKDNHRMILQPESLEGPIKKIRRKTKKPIEVEVDNLNQLKQIINAKPDIILLDNMNLSRIKAAVNYVNKLKGGKKPLLEASGGVTLKNVRTIAKTGVDRISVGALTHSVRAINVSMEITRS